MTSTMTPDASTSALQLRSAPPLEPPYDDAPIKRHVAELANAVDQPLLPCFNAADLGSADFRTANFGTANFSIAKDQAAIGVDSDYPRNVGENRGFCRQRAASSQLPEPRNHARKLVQALMEMIAGARPLGQLVPWLHETLYFELADQYGAVRAANRHTARYRNRRNASEPRSNQVRTRVASVRTCEPADGIVEVSAVVHDRGRSYAVALRMEGLDGGWRCTDFAVV